MCAKITKNFCNISKSSIELLDALNTFLLAQSQCTSLQIQTSCGPGLWYHVAYLNMSNPAEQCPSAWREYNSGGVRACGRPASTSESCPGVRYSTHFTQDIVPGTLRWQHFIWGAVNMYWVAIITFYHTSLELMQNSSNCKLLPFTIKYNCSLAESYSFSVRTHVILGESSNSTEWKMSGRCTCWQLAVYTSATRTARELQHFSITAIPYNGN